MTHTIRSDIAADELRRLAAQEKDEKVAARMRAISCALEGLPRKEAAARERMKRPVLGEWIVRYNTAGLDGLRDRLRRQSAPREGTLAEKRPDLARWFPEDRNGMPAFAVPFKSNLVREWQCWSCHAEGVEKYYPRVVHQQLRGWDAGAGVCPECEPKQQSRTHRKRQLDLKGALAETHLELAAEYRENNRHPATEITATHKTPVWWRCVRCRHEWRATPYTRAIMGCGCQRCGMGFSRIELRFYCELKTAFPDTEHRYTAGGRLPEIDIYLPSLRLGIEIDGHYHATRLEQDRRKNKTLEEAGIRLVRVRRTGLPAIEPCLPLDFGLKHDVAFAAFLRWLAPLAPGLRDFADAWLAEGVFKGEERFRERTAKGQPMPPPGTSLLDTHPWVSQVWADSNQLGPEYYTNGSHIEVDWVCVRNREHLYRAKVADRLRSGLGGCKYCVGAYHLTYERSLAAKKPTIAKEWDEEKNGKAASEIFANSAEDGWFRCSMGHLWRARIADRKESHPHYAGCETCDIERRKPISLMAKHPLLMRDWKARAPSRR